MISCITMIRNEADILSGFLNHALSLFDHLYIIDVQSTDGTFEILKGAVRDNSGRISLFSCKTQEKYQSAMINRLARIAFDDGADWVFPLDGDEFIAVQSRQELQAILKSEENNVIAINWRNLVPTEMGSFSHFDLSQTFYLRPDGEMKKVAISRRYADLNPGFYIHEGNHLISSLPLLRPEIAACELNIYHLPVRSLSRLKYKTRFAAQLLKSKIGTNAEEGRHVADVLNQLERNATSVTDLQLIAANYSVGVSAKKQQWVVWEKVSFGPSITEAVSGSSLARDEQTTIQFDGNLHWDRNTFLQSAFIGSFVQGDEIKISVLPISKFGGGMPIYDRYKKLEISDLHGTEVSKEDLLVSILSAQLYASRRVFSDLKICPLMVTILDHIKPIRCVFFGQNRFSRFLTACSYVDSHITQSRCIGIYPNYERVHVASEREMSRDRFEFLMGENFPRHHIINDRFAVALEHFDAGSIDFVYLTEVSSIGNLRHILTALQSKITENSVLIIERSPGLSFEDPGMMQFLGELNKIGRGGYVSSDLYVAHIGPNSSRLSSFLELFQLKPELAQLLEEKSNGSAVIGGVNSGHSISSTEDARGALRRFVYWFVADSIFTPILLPPARKLNRLRRLAQKKIQTEMSQFRPTKYVVVDESLPELSFTRGLNPKIKLVIPTRGCSRWLVPFLDEYVKMGLSPTYVVDNGCEQATLEILERRNIETIKINEDELGNGESIMPYISKVIEEEYIFRLDDDEFPTIELLKWINTIPDSKLSYVHSWWMPRLEIAMIDGVLSSCHPKHLRTKVGFTQRENLHGGRFYRHRDVTYNKVGPHHGNFISDYVSHAPSKALIVHLDYLVRSPQERLNKIRNTEKRFPGAGWIFANHMIPEMAPRKLLYARPFSPGNLLSFFAKLQCALPQGGAIIDLSIDEIREIQEDRLTSEIIHVHY